MSEAKARRGDPRFHALLEEMAALHEKKAADYGRDGDCLANLRASESLGVDPFVALVVRMGDKFTRIGSFLKKGRLENESVIDSLLDVACYSLLGIVLLREKGGAA